MDIDYIKQMII